MHCTQCESSMVMTASIRFNERTQAPFPSIKDYVGAPSRSRDALDNHSQHPLRTAIYCARCGYVKVLAQKPTLGLGHGETSNPARVAQVGDSV